MLCFCRCVIVMGCGSHLWSKLSALSRGNMALVASASNDKDRALLTPLLAEVTSHYRAHHRTIGHVYIMKFEHA